MERTMKKIKIKIKIKKDLILNISNYKKVKHKIESIWINSQKKKKLSS
jgi:hypothetical protein